MKRLNIMLYLDPGTGSLIIQGIIALFVAVAAFSKFYWNRLKVFFSELFRKRS